MRHIRYTTTQVNENGGYKINQHDDFARDMLMFAGKRLEILIRPIVKTRSVKQNRYYWGTVVALVREGLKELGYGAYMLDPETVHNMLKDKFLQEVLESDITGEMIKITKSTTELSTTEFKDYVAEIQAWAVEFLGVYIPDPNEQLTLDMTDAGDQAELGI